MFDVFRRTAGDRWKGDVLSAGSVSFEGIALGTWFVPVVDALVVVLDGKLSSGKDGKSVLFFINGDLKISASCPSLKLKMMLCKKK